MSTAESSGGSGGGLKLPQLKRSRGAHRGVFTRRAKAIQQAGGPLEDVQATLEFLIDRRKMMSELDAQIQQLIEDDDDLEADVEDAADVFMAAKRQSNGARAESKSYKPSAQVALRPQRVAVLLQSYPSSLFLHSVASTPNGSPSGTNSQHWSIARWT